MTELEKRLMNELTNFAEQYTQDQKWLTGQIERFEGEVKRFVVQLKLGEKQSERLQGRVEELASRLTR